MVSPCLLPGTSAGLSFVGFPVGHIASSEASRSPVKSLVEASFVFADMCAVSSVSSARAEE